MKVREPNGPVQVTPVGLLGMLSLKTGGQMPDAMRQDIQPGIDMEDWWLRAQRVVDRTNRGITLAAAVINDYVDYSPNAIIVPEQEWWFVHSISVRSTPVGAGDSFYGLRQALAFNSTGTIRFRFVGDPGPTAAITTASVYPTLMAERFWAPPGSRIGFYVGEVVGPGGLAVDVVGFDYTVLPL